MPECDAVIVGSGPNGLSAAICLALYGLKVVVFEEKNMIGGGATSLQLTLPGFTHDVCSSIHPLAIGSPFFRRLPLEQYGLKWIQPAVPLAHPFDDGTAAILDQTLSKTSEALHEDGLFYEELMKPFVQGWTHLEDFLLGPLSFPRHPLLASRFAIKALTSCVTFAKKFKTEKAKALFAGLAGHSILPLDRCFTTGVGLILAIFGHVYGWPLPERGAKSISQALAKYFDLLGGKIIKGVSVKSLEQLPPCQAILFDLTPRQIVDIAQNSLSPKYIRQLKKYRYGPGVFKMDWALKSPIPWKAQECLLAGTVHLGGTLEEIAKSEALVWQGMHSERPFVLLAQHSLFDPTRAPTGDHTVWAYCHVPHGSTVDMSEYIENQIERYAPGFKKCILAKSQKNTVEMQKFNSNYIGGDIIGGVQDFWQQFFRPTMRLDPYTTSHPKIFICSSSTPPGGGVHGMCGFHAAKSVLKRRFGFQVNWESFEEKIQTVSMTAI